MKRRAVFMVPETNARQTSYRCLLAAAMVILAGGGFVGAQLAQDLPQPQKIEQAVPDLTKVNERGPRPKDSAAFLDETESLTNNDQFFEVTLGQGRILALKEPLVGVGKDLPLIAAGDPGVIEFAFVNNRQIRVMGLAIGVTDLAITTAKGKTYTFEVRVTADLNPLRGQLHRSFPDATVKLSQIRDHVVVEGQARNSAQAAKIIDTISAYMDSILKSQERKVTNSTVTPSQPKGDGKKDPDQLPAPQGLLPSGMPFGPVSPGLQVDSKIAQPRIINLLRIPGPQQVLLKVRIAELNRTAFRQIGADILAVDPKNGALIGTKIGDNSAGARVNATREGLTGVADLFGGGPATVFGVFENSNFSVFVNALRRNEVLKILAEPNLVALNGHQATFLAGGEFPVPVPLAGSNGGAGAVTIEFKKFGISLNFKPDILDGGVVRLAVDPEVSSIDFSIGTKINGTEVPGLNTRKAHTVVEMREGQTLAMAGLLSVTLEGKTNRIPGLGDMPVLGPFFSNTTSKRTEKELIVLVTPYLVDALPCDQVPPVPGAEVNGPNDLEFYLGNRIEGKTGRDWRATTGRYTSPPVPVPVVLRLHTEYIRGPHGFSD